MKIRRDKLEKGLPATGLAPFYSGRGAHSVKELEDIVEDLTQQLLNKQIKWQRLLEYTKTTLIWKKNNSSSRIRKKKTESVSTARLLRSGGSSHKPGKIM